MKTDRITSLLREIFAGAFDGKVAADPQRGRDLVKLFRAITGDVVLSSISCAIAANDLSDSIAVARDNLRIIKGVC
jgi:hypothetical protein